jgi:hypothetical protein
MIYQTFNFKQTLFPFSNTASFFSLSKLAALNIDDIFIPVRKHFDPKRNNHIDTFISQ